MCRPGVLQTETHTSSGLSHELEGPFAWPHVSRDLIGAHQVGQLHDVNSVSPGCPVEWADVRVLQGRAEAVLCAASSRRFDGCKLFREVISIRPVLLPFPEVFFTAFRPAFLLAAFLAPAARRAALRSSCSRFSRSRASLRPRERRCRSGAAHSRELVELLPAEPELEWLRAVNEAMMAFACCKVAWASSN